VVFVIIIAAAAASNSGSNNSSNNNNISQTTAPADIVLSGKGDTVTKTFNLTAGDAIFAMSHDGSGNFAIWFHNSSGKQTDLLVNTAGKYSGSTLEGVMSSTIILATPGTYYLDVSADGNWTVTIQQPPLTSAFELPLTFAGTSDNAYSAFTATSGTVKFTMSYTGTGNFAVILYDNNGNYVNLLANEVGSYNGSKSQSFSGTGIYYLAVTGVGSWSITVTHM
jgi:hypothetical protein